MPPKPSPAIVSVSGDDFETEVLRSPGATLVDFWAVWCGPCRLVAPELEKIAATDRRLRITKLDVDHSPATASRLGVLSIPTLVLFVAGEERARIVGAADYRSIMARLEPHLPS